MPATADGTATLIQGQAALAGKDSEFAEWQENLHAAASRYPGYLGSEIQRPTSDEPEWVGVYQFDSAEHLHNWLNSATRQDYLNRGAGLVDGLGTQQIIVRDEKVDDALVTVIVSHAVPQEKVDDFLAWQDEMIQAESKYPGFCGSEIIRPIEGVQDDWIVCYRFKNAESLDAWLTSDDRERLLNRPDFGDFHLHRIEHPFGSWFSYGSNDAVPSKFKTSMAVLFGLYPTAVIIGVLSRQMHFKFWLDMLVCCAAGSFAMTYISMPHFANRILDWWLNPAEDTRRFSREVLGVVLVVAVTAVAALVTYLCTVRFWTLPPP